MGCDYRKPECTNDGRTIDGQWVCSNHLPEKKDAKDERIATLEEALRDAEHLCKWLLQSDISEADRERVVRENGVNFTLALQAKS